MKLVQLLTTEMMMSTMIHSVDTASMRVVRRTVAGAKADDRSSQGFISPENASRARCSRHRRSAVAVHASSRPVANNVRPLKACITADRSKPVQSGVGVYY